MQNNELINLDNKVDHSKEIENLVTEKSVTARGSIADKYIAMQSNFKTQNKFTSATTTIRAADAEISEIRMHIPTSSNELDYSQKNSVVIAQDTNNLIQVSEEPNGIAIIDDIFSVSSIADEFREKYIEAKETASEAISFSKSFIKTEIKDGTISAKYSIYSSEGDILQNLESLNVLKSQVNLDNSLTEDQAEEFHNKIYEKFSILNSSSPVVTNLDRKTVTQSDLLLSRTYSKDKEAAIKVTQSITKHYNYPVLNDVLAIITIGIAKGDEFPRAPSVGHVMGLSESTLVVERKDPLKIIHATDRDELDKMERYEAAGVYSSEFNVALFLREEERGVHELTHAAMNILFNHNANPYSEDLKEIYYTAEKEFLLNVVAKISKDVDENLQSSNVNIHHNLLFSPIVALLAMSITPDLDINKFFKGFNQKYLLKKFQDAYFKDMNIEDITLDHIKNKHLEEMDRLEINDSQANILAKIGIILLHYNYEQFNGELVSTMAELYHESEYMDFVRDMFAPIDQYWQNNIHPLVEDSLIIPHQLECSGEVNSNEFVYCVQEFML
jgi:hypothetical protein